MGLHKTIDLLIASWFWRWSYNSYLWGSNNQPSGSNLAFLSAHVNLCCVAVRSVSRSVAYVRTSALN
jgi:hypothetical protein